MTGALWLDAPAQVSIRYRGGQRDHVVEAGGERWKIPAGVETTITFGAPKGYSQFVAEADWTSSNGTPEVLSVALARGRAHHDRTAVTTVGTDRHRSRSATSHESPFRGNHKVCTSELPESGAATYAVGQGYLAVAIEHRSSANNAHLQGFPMTEVAR